MPKAKTQPKHLIERIIEGIDLEKLRFTTADGATVGPGDSVWDINGNEYGVTGFRRVQNGEELDILGDSERQAVSLKIGELYSDRVAAMRAKIKVLLADLSVQGWRQKEAIRAGMNICDEIHEIERAIKAALASQES